MVLVTVLLKWLLWS